MMNFISLFSGIGGFDLGFERAGMTCLAQVENNTHANQILAKHWPDVIRYEDVKHVGSSNLPNVDVLCGGFPCQDVSVAGKRAGLAGERSGLWFEFLRILTELAPRIVVIENVPGLLSSNSGRDFEVILQGLVQCGYRVSWRVLDAQYFGVAQRRRRVFLVGSLGEGRSAEILFERESGTGHSESRRSPRPELATDIAASLRSRGDNTGTRIDDETGLAVINRMRGFGDYELDTKAGALKARDGKDATDLLTVEAIDVRNFTSNGDLSGTLQAKKSGGYSLNYQNPIAIHAKNGQDISPALMGEGHDSGEDGLGRHAFAVSSMGVRRLTPLECERLQGFPDYWTEGLSDSARFQRLGNAVCVSVAEWLGRRIVDVYA